MKIGIFGGSFDPPHIGHMQSVEGVQKKYKLDKIIWIPSAIPPHKHSPIASTKDRINMIKLAIKYIPNCEISTIELDKERKSYTIDTLRELRKMYPTDKFYLIIGADELHSFDKWKSPSEITKLCKIIAIDRSRLGNIKGSLFYPLEVDVSSSQIRKLQKKGKAITGLVSKEVEKYIKREGLYI
jgi:nicotinate-nucleotide adenylyltransferase